MNYPDTLSARDIEIIKLMAAGHPAKVIGPKIGLSFETVTKDIAAARRIAKAKNSTALVATALRKGWIK